MSGNGANGSDRKFKWVGTRPIRHDGVDKVTGRAKYGADVRLSGTLHGWIVRSPYAHARIKGIEETRTPARLGGVATGGQALREVAGLPVGRVAGVLAVGVLLVGIIVFSGGTNDRKFRAFDASNGKLLWDVTTNSGVIGPASSFSVNGKQYIAVQSGWGIDARAMQNRLIKMMPGLPDVPEGGAIWVFALP